MRMAPSARWVSIVAAAVALVVAATPADATIYRDMSAGSACKAAYAGVSPFVYSATHLENKGVVDLYVVCQFQHYDIGAAQSPLLVSVALTAGTLGGTAVCVVQTGYYNGTVHNSAVVARGVPLAAGASGQVVWEGADLPRASEADVLTLNCKLPGGFRMGLIEVWEPEPVSGQGWTP
jgi:hypothetical protein